MVTLTSTKVQTVVNSPSIQGTFQFVEFASPFNIGTWGLAGPLVYETVSMATWHGHCAEGITSALLHLLSHLACSAKIVMIACNGDTPALSHLCGQCAANVLGPTASAGSVQQTSPTLEICDAITTLCQTMLHKVLWVILSDIRMWCLIQLWLAPDCGICCFLCPSYLHVNFSIDILD